MRGILFPLDGMGYAHIWILKRVQDDSGRLGTIYKQKVHIFRVILNLFQDSPLFSLIFFNSCQYLSYEKS